jgi:thiamine biosynthesis lipoprotein
MHSSARRPWSLATLLLAASGVAAQTAAIPAGFTEFSREAMGCRFSVVLPVRSPNDRAAVEAALDEVERLDAVLSTWRADSFASHVNRTAAKAPVRLDPEFEDLLARCQQLHRDTDGAFDVTVGPFVRAWGFLGGPARVPGEAELAVLRTRAGCEHLRLDRAAHTVQFAREGLELDFGAIGKGEAVDAMVRILRQSGVERALVQGGTSTVAGIGSPPGRDDGWAIAIRNPAGAAPLTTVPLRDRALSVSGDQERGFVVDGVRYGHIVDPRTGRPARACTLAVAVADSAAASDALATAFYVLGEAGTRTCFARFSGIRAILCIPDERVAVSRYVSLGETSTREPRR